MVLNFYYVKHSVYCVIITVCYFLCYPWARRNYNFLAVFNSTGSLSILFCVLNVGDMRDLCLSNMCFCLTMTSIRAADKIICINSDCRIGNKNVLMEISLIKLLDSLWNVVKELCIHSGLFSCLRYKPYNDAENMRSSSSFNVCASVYVLSKWNFSFDHKWQLFWLNQGPR